MRNQQKILISKLFLNSTSHSFFVVLFFSLIFSFISCKQENQHNLELWYNTPASDWNEALPLGNGRLGAMVYGNPSDEIIQLNENTLWAGGPHRNDNLKARESLSEIREFLFTNKYKEAKNLADSNFVSKISHGMPYETVGNLNLHFSNHENYTNYHRALDIEKAVNTTDYEVNGVRFKRQIFTSFTDQVIVIKVTANKEGQINFSATMNRPKPAKVTISTEDNNILKMVGFSSDRLSKRIKNGNPIKGQVEFESRVKIVPDGGTLISNDSILTVSNANSAILYVSIATNFVNYQDVSANPHKRASDYIQKAEKKNFNQLLKKHTSFYQSYFDRVSLHLGQTDSIKKPTNTRIKEFSTGNDPALAVLYFQFGRYLLISSSQPGGQPANLQGLWCNQLTPQWKSAYTVNINTEMNYWPAEVTNLPEMHEPLIKMVKELSVTGKETAKEMYGAKGWVTHHNTDIWRITAPVDGSWGVWPTGGTWLSQHLWEKYMFNGDLEYLRSVYPTLKGATQFCLSFLVKEPENGWLVMTPSMSPENKPKINKGVTLAAGTTMDNQLVYDILTKTASAAKLLQDDTAFVAEIENTLTLLPPMQVGQHNQLQEWLKDWDNPKDKHRHISHLYGLYPSNQISPYRNPELFEASKNTLIQRGDPSTGWSMNWKINLWARLLDGNHAYKLMKNQIKLVESKNPKRNGGTYTNMLDAHPPFQIDGNFGFTSGLAEMLVQSHDETIHLIPALPDSWKEGNVKGLRARGGFEITSLEWKNGEVVKVIITSTLGGNCRIRSYNQLQFEDENKIKKASGNNTNPFYNVPTIKKPLVSKLAKLNKVILKKTYLYDVETEAGQEIVLIMNKNAKNE